MRVGLVGTSHERDRLRLELFESGVEIVGEAPTLEAARRAGHAADAIVLATSGRRTSFDPNVAGSAPLNLEDDAVSSEELTPRELDVTRLLALGLTNRAIADRLGISDQTVKFHVASIIGKLGATNRTDVVRRAARAGLIEL